MATSTVTARVYTKKRTYWQNLAVQLWNHRYLYLMLLPPILFFLVFRYYPMLGNVIAFKKFQAVHGIWDSPWVGFKHFHDLFTDPVFLRVLRNTVWIAFLKLLIVFPAPILLALFLNEIHHLFYKRVLQTVVYAPHFMSWVIYGAILYIVLSPANGLINNILNNLGFTKIPFFQVPGLFVPIVIASSILKETGFLAIIYLATISAIDPTLYEAAIMDGANRWRLMWHVTLPGLRVTIITLFILQIGFFLNVGFEQIFILQNAMVLTTGDIIETFIYRVGIQKARFDFTTAAGLFNGLVGMVMVLLADRLAKRLDLPGIF
ncbi:MAG TPA: ABC transporter permease subunit [Caldilineaceae bacterium]|nr:ABC transporter permease subunit [Caldilineaceae bacterium]